MKRPYSSRASGFYKKTLSERQQWLQETVGIDPTLSFDPNIADAMVENVVGTYPLPWAIATNFCINHRDYLVPMCIEEPSVVAAASRAALWVREAGGFEAQADPSIMIGQVYITDVLDLQQAMQAILQSKDILLQTANQAKPSLLQRGGGARELEVRLLPSQSSALSHPSSTGAMAVHLLVDCVDAMGANVVNTMVEAIGPLLGELSQGTPQAHILSNLALQRMVHVRCSIPASVLHTKEWPGHMLRDRIVSLSNWAQQDPYRAATHNKGILNGIDAVAIATGNDWRSIEAGAHAYAAMQGSYQPLSHWQTNEHGNLCGQLSLPLAVGTQGGTLAVHPIAQASLRILDVTQARELAMVMGAVGLANNLAALRALAGPGIQKAHMPLHQRSVPFRASLHPAK